MVEKSQPAESSARTQRLWLHIGLRLQNRRVQKGFTEAAVAAHLGIPLTRYQAFEAGRAETPAMLLAQLADLFKVSIFNFFQDVSFGEIEPQPSSSSEPAPVFSVATDEERVAALVSDFSKLNRERQQYVLLLARALVEDTRDQ